MADQPVTPCPFRADRGEQDGWIDLEMARGIRVDVGGAKDAFDRVILSEQQAACLHIPAFRRMRPDFIEQSPCNRDTHRHIARQWMRGCR